MRVRAGVVASFGLVVPKRRVRFPRPDWQKIYIFGDRFRRFIFDNGTICRVPRCPTCGATFDTRRGLGVHHSLKHEERLPNRTCERCGTEFFCEYARKYCSRECLKASTSQTGESNPNYRGGKTSTTCELCDTEFEYYESTKKGLYCPSCVVNETWRKVPKLMQKDNPQWKDGKTTLTCDVCERSFKRYPSQIQSETTVCSRDCLNEWLSEEFTGEGHPNWKGGGNQEYGPGWKEARERALERDRYQCKLCGTTQADLSRKPDVHHIIPVRLFEASQSHNIKEAHILHNLICLCPSCHRRAEFGVVDRDRLYELIGVNQSDIDTAVMDSDSR